MGLGGGGVGGEGGRGLDLNMFASCLEFKVYQSGCHVSLVANIFREISLSFCLEL